MTSQRRKNESPLWNLGINIFLPVMILNWSAKWSFDGAAEAGLILGLLPPVIYGAWDWFKNHNRNGMSLLGVINVLFTGGLAIFDVEPYWFVIKEAFFPFILGAAVFLTEFVSEKPFFAKMLRQADGFNWPKIDAVIAEKGQQQALKTLLRNCNRLFATSFMISSALNYWLADRIFRKMPVGLDAIARKHMLNEQIAEMTWKGWVVIALPLMVFMGAVFWYLFRNIKKISGLEVEEMTSLQSDESETS